MKYPINSPESKLIDAIYELQLLRDVNTVRSKNTETGGETEGRDENQLYSELAVIGDKIELNCTVLKDEHTNNRIVITDLPADQKKFNGAAVWISNPEVGVAIDAGQWQASPYDVIFWIDEAVKVRYLNPRKGSRIPFNTEILANSLTVPNIKPIAQSEIDPREIPEELEYISVPQTDSYTLTSRISDIDIEQKRLLIAKRFGVIEYDIDKSTTFDISIHEVFPSETSYRFAEFDREFTLLLHLGEPFKLDATPWGQPETVIKGRDFKIRILREGILISAIQNGNEVSCIPSKSTQNFIDRILRYSSEI